MAGTSKKNPKRCPWVDVSKPDYVAYHDLEWGVPVHDERRLFEFLTLEGAQAGLSWYTVLRKREAYRKAFSGFDPEKVIDVSAVRTERAIVYYFRDPGAGFDATALSESTTASAAIDPLAHLEYRAAQGIRPGGFGMLIVRQLVDEVMYSENGNEVLLIKHIR